MYKEKKAEKVDPMQARRAKWTCCAFSGKPLQQPIVADEYGSLFNKVEMLLGMQARKAGDEWPQNLAHIARMKDLIPVKPTVNVNYRPDSGQQAERPSNDAPFECPIAGLPLNGTFRAVLHRATGVLLSDKALKAAPAAVRGVLLEAAAAALEGSKRASPAGAPKESPEAAALARVVEDEGAHSEEDWLVVNPEGADAEAAKDRIELVVARRAKGSRGKAKEAVKRLPAAASTTVRAKRAKNSILESLFHDDGEGARVQETYLCRSIGARGMNLT